MRHRKSGRKFNRNSSHRKAMMRNMVTSLLQHERIETTDARAKELRPYVEKLITLGRRGDLHARRQVASVLQSSDVVKKLFDEIGPRFKERPGGYTRIIKLGRRFGDAASMSFIELVGSDFTPRPSRKKAEPVKEEAAAEEAAPETEASAEAQADSEASDDAEEKSE